MGGRAAAAQAGGRSNVAGEVDIEGRVEPGFEPVREAFARNFEEGLEVGASFAVCRGATRLVDLWGGHRDRARARAWQRDTLVNVYSTTKGMAALVCAMLVDRGRLDYAAPVADYWPQFAANGKRDVTVRGAGPGGAHSASGGSSEACASQ